jgi:hypothetical protein
MLRVRVTAETSARPERVLEAARDFSERRAEVWPNVSVGQLEVHERGDRSADVTEGLFRGVFWERCRYEWSQPSAVTATVLDSNILQPGSSWEITATPADDGTHVEATFVRDYKGGLKGRFAKTLFRVAGSSLARSDLRRALAKIEAGESPR